MDFFWRTKDCHYFSIGAIDLILDKYTFYQNVEVSMQMIPSDFSR